MRDARGRLLPGNNNNPMGRGSPGWQRRAATAKEVSSLLDRLMHMPTPEFNEFMRDPARVKIELILGNTIQAAENGDFRALDLLLTRMIGKPKEVIELQNPKPIYIESPSKTLLIGLDYEKDTEAEIHNDNRKDIEVEPVHNSGSGIEPPKP